MSTKLPDYQQVSEALSHASAVISPSEAHGILCGLFTVGKTNDIDGMVWVQSMTSGGFEESLDLCESKLKVLGELFNKTKEMFAKMEFNFEALLPDDEQDLALRAEELGCWCEGYLSGLGLGDINLNELKSPEVQDQLSKLSEISQIDYENIDITEADEQAFTEVSEFLRVVVMSLHLEVLQFLKAEDSDDEVAGDVQYH